LLATGAVGLAVCIVFAVKVGQKYQQSRGRGDFARFSLGYISFHTACCLPDGRLEVRAKEFGETIFEDLARSARVTYKYVTVTEDGRLQEAESRNAPLAGGRRVRRAIRDHEPLSGARQREAGDTRLRDGAEREIGCL